MKEEQGRRALLFARLEAVEALRIFVEKGPGGCLGEGDLLFNGYYTKVRIYRKGYTQYVKHINIPFYK